jgi:hypothetical protein
MATGCELWCFVKLPAGSGSPTAENVAFLNRLAVSSYGAIPGRVPLSQTETRGLASVLMA